MRMFQYSDAKSHKFWNIDVRGASFTVTYGKIGTAGQTKTKSFPSSQKAQAAAEKLIMEKVGKGYVETTPRTMSSEAEAFEKTIQANPRDLAGVAAYADFLAERDDPRGEFMQIQIALENESLPKPERKKLLKREVEFLGTHEAEWVGNWAEHFDAPTSTEGRGQINHTGGRKYEFKRGLLSTANFGELTVAAARAFVQSPQTRFIHELFIGYYAYEEDGDDDTARQMLLGWPHMRHVRRFQYGWIADEVYGDFCNFQCHLPGEHVYDFVKQMPDVEELLIFAHFTDSVKLVALPMPHLRVLQLYHGYSYPLDRLAKNPWLTNLTHLLCHPHALEGDQAFIGLTDLRAICRSEYLKNLTHLRLRLTDFGDEGVRVIINSGILKRLKLLDLRHGSITDEGAKLLAECPDLKNLEHLDLSRNGLTETGKNALIATKVSVSLEFQHAEIGGQEDYGSRPRYLFEGDYE
ncbi:MAG: WGR domain-containing protein [Planctomycetes bacterium]|nr:WGR domain-containing protein [Planctomycetota bacterium]